MAEIDAETLIAPDVLSNETPDANGEIVDRERIAYLRRIPKASAHCYARTIHAEAMADGG
jgi:hypothetical protein